MLDALSTLGADARFEREGVTLTEAPHFILTQVAGDEKVMKKSFGKLPAKVGAALANGDRNIFRIGPKQFWFVGDTIEASEGVYVTPLSSGRTRMMLEGPRACEVLASCATIDFDASQFKPGHFVMTGIHHTPVTIHCIGDNRFHVYALRTFALNVWEWLCDVADG
jgi:methylglutamate dehydrogenase subunit D